MTDTSTNKSGSFLNELLLNGQIAWRLYTDPRVSMLLKVAVPVVTLLYVIMPIDLLPDFIPFIGQLDEVAIALLAIRAFVALAPSDIVAEYRNSTKGSSGGKQAGSTGSGPSQETSNGGASRKASGNGTGAKANYDDVVDAEYRVVNDD